MCQPQQNIMLEFSNLVINMFRTEGISRVASFEKLVKFDFEDKTALKVIYTLTLFNYIYDYPFLSASFNEEAQETKKSWKSSTLILGSNNTRFNCTFIKSYPRYGYNNYEISIRLRMRFVCVHI
eukprot:Mrub_05392.p1 GENE.Mrub_05392~~Mrub_05392.p1  ORF type:complete len:124 (+),score=2.16 Mrub_05392:318-689(+)